MQPTDANSTGAPEMRGTAGRGLAFMLANTVASKAMALVSLAVVGTLLSEREWGLYGLAISVMMFVQSLRDGGVRELLVQRGREWDSLVGPAFWLSATINAAVGLAVGLAGEAVAHAYAAAGKIESPGELSRLLWVAAASNLLAAPSSILTARLALDLRFKALAWLHVCTSAVRYASQIVLAYQGFGALSLMIPMVAVTVLEGVAAWWLTREAPWCCPLDVRRWRSIIGSSWWLVLSQTGNGVANSGYLLVAGAFLVLPEIGAYVFAFNLLMQIEASVTFSLSQVMFPVLVRLRAEPERQVQAAARVARAASLLTTLLALGLAVTYTPLERMVWGGKWAEAALPLAILAALYPVRAVFGGVGVPLLQAEGRFRSCAAAWGTVAAGTLGATLAWGGGSGGIGGLAAWVGGATAALCLGLLVIALGARGMRVTRVLHTVVLPAGVGVVLAAAVWWLGTLWGPWLVVHAGGGLEVWGHRVRWSDAAEFLLAGGVFTVLLVGAARWLAPEHVSDVLSVLPGGLRRRAAAALRVTTY